MPKGFAVIPMGLEDIGPNKGVPVPQIKKGDSTKSPTKQSKPGALKIIAISGSLRKKSTNTGLIRACININNPDLDIEWADINPLPMFNEDLETNTPEVVLNLKEKVRKADGVLFAVPENNFNVSAPLKNAYDWLSRGETPWKLKPCAMVSSAAMTGGELAQKSFRQTVGYCKVNMMEKPEIYVKRFSGKYFDNDGNLVDE